MNLGGGRYVPGSDSSAMDTSGPSSNYDPFTGAGRYIPGGNSTSNRPTSHANQDPFTGAGRYVPNGDHNQTSRPLSASQTSALSKTKLVFVVFSNDKLFLFTLETHTDSPLTSSFPQTQYATMTNADTTKILSKLKAFNDSITGDGIRLSDSQVQQLTELINGNISNLEAKMDIVFQLLKWPIDKIFPILDIIRLLVMNSTICRYLFENEAKTKEFISQLLSYVQSDQSVNTMLVFRALTNLFSNELTEKYLIKNSNSIIPKTLLFLPITNKNTQFALANVILNYCIYSYKRKDQNFSKYLYDCYQEFLNVNLESDVAKCLILGLGTLFCTNADLVLDVRTTSKNNAKEFFTALDKSSSKYTADTLACLEQCRALVNNL